MKDFERIEELQRYKNRMFQALLNARETLDNEYKKNHNDYFLTGSITIGTILLEYAKLQKEESK